MVKVIFIIIVVFGYPLATHENKISCKSTTYRILLVLEAGLEPAQPQWPRDFKSLAQFHHSSSLLSYYHAIKQTLILPHLY